MPSSTHPDMFPFLIDRLAKAFPTIIKYKSKTSNLSQPSTTPDKTFAMSQDTFLPSKALNEVRRRLQVIGVGRFEADKIHDATKEANFQGEKLS
jgi:hypothetical protein